MPRVELASLARSGWSHPRSRLVGWALMAAGVLVGALDHRVAVLAAVLIVGGVVLSRVWTWQIDPVEQRAWREPSTAPSTAWLRWSEIVCGVLFATGLGALLFDRDAVAVAAGLALAAWIGSMFVLGKPDSL